MTGSDGYELEQLSCGEASNATEKLKLVQPIADEVPTHERQAHHPSLAFGELRMAGQIARFTGLAV